MFWWLLESLSLLYVLTHDHDLGDDVDEGVDDGICDGTFDARDVQKEGEGTRR